MVSQFEAMVSQLAGQLVSQYSLLCLDGEPVGANLDIDYDFYFHHFCFVQNHSSFVLNLVIHFQIFQQVEKLG